jgi:hypothetical protein
LYKAALRDQAEIVRLLMSRGATAEACHRDGWSALYAAVQTGAIRSVHALLDCGANVNYRASNGNLSNQNNINHNNNNVIAIPPPPTSSSPSLEAPSSGVEMYPPLFIAIRVFNLALIEHLCAWGADCDRAPSPLVAAVAATVTATHSSLGPPPPTPRTLSSQLSLKELETAASGGPLDGFEQQHRRRSDRSPTNNGSGARGITADGRDNHVVDDGPGNNVIQEHQSGSILGSRWRWPWQWCTRRVHIITPVEYARSQGDEWYSDARTRQMLHAMRNGKHTYACKLTASLLLQSTYAWPQPVVRMFLSYVC